MAQEFQKSIVDSLMDDEIWEMVTSKNPSKNIGYDPIREWDNDLKAVFNMELRETVDGNYSALIKDVEEAYYSRTGFITTHREIEEHFPYVWIDGDFFVTDSYPFNIELSQTEEDRIEGATQYQKEVILHNNTNLLCFATAGSGKTRSITNMVALQIQKKTVLPERVAMITFTRKAANEMASRLKQILGTQAYEVKINTFHGMCRYLLEKIPEHLFQWFYEDKDGKKKQMKVIDESQSLSLLKSIHPNAGDLYYKIQKYKLKLIGKDDFEAQEWEIRKEYEQALKERFFIDFSGLLDHVLTLSERDEAYEFFQNQFDLVVVDEYQDSNPLQAELARLFAGDKGQLVVVGDDDQSIFEFQGATPDNILQFEKEHEDNVKKVFLPENFRCAPPIFKAAKNLIAHNKKRAEKKMMTCKTGDSWDPIVVKGCHNEKQTTAYIKKAIGKWAAEGTEYGAIAVLGRTNKLLAEIYGLLSEELPCDYGNMNFHNRMEIKDLKAYLDFIADEYDQFAFHRIGKLLPGVGPKSIQGIMVLLEKNIGLSTILEKKEVKLSKKAKKSLDFFSEKIEEIRNIYATKTVGDIIEFILNDMEFGSTYKESERSDRLENVSLLLLSIDRNLILSQFLKDFETYEIESNQITFSTIHKAKGREWDKVILIGCNDGMLPHFSEEDLEIERRLAFVAITRAKESLILMYDANEPKSQFIAECDLNGPLDAEDYAPVDTIKPPKKDNEGSTPDDGIETAINGDMDASGEDLMPFFFSEDHPDKELVHLDDDFCEFLVAVHNKETRFSFSAMDAELKKEKDWAYNHYVEAVNSNYIRNYNGRWRVNVAL